MRFRQGKFEPLQHKTLYPEIEEDIFKIYVFAPHHVDLRHETLSFLFLTQSLGESFAQNSYTHSYV
jgi:hypothetical protein